MRAFGSVVAMPIDVNAATPGAYNCLNGDGATITSSGYNYSDDDTCEFDAATDEQNAADPLLGPLASNGGPTLTHLPQTGSPLINAIPIASCGGGDALAGEAVTTDQRGVTRPQETGCEIGSVEIVAPIVVPIVTPTFTG